MIHDENLRDERIHGGSFHDEKTRRGARTHDDGTTRNRCEKPHEV